MESLRARGDEGHPLFVGTSVNGETLVAATHYDAVNGLAVRTEDPALRGDEQLTCIRRCARVRTCRRGTAASTPQDPGLVGPPATATTHVAWARMADRTDPASKLPPGSTRIVHPAPFEHLFVAADFSAGAAQAVARESGLAKLEDSLRELGFADRPEQVVTGPMLERVAAQGERSVDALIRLGHFVAVTGDGRRCS